MDKAYEALLDELERSKLDVDDSTNKIERCSKRLDHCQLLIRQLRDIYLKKLSNDNDEVLFFKKIKPTFDSELHYQKQLFDYFKTIPKGSIKLKKQHINQSLEKASVFISQYNELNQYMLFGETHLDKIYFRRIPYNLKMHSALEFPVDQSWSSPADLTLSKLQANRRFIQFLKNELYALKNPSLDPTWEFARNLNWNGTKTDLIELVYALTASKVIDSELKDTIQLMEQIFNLDLGNFYRTYTDIKYKKNPASFLDQLKASLLEKIRKENQ